MDQLLTPKEVSKILQISTWSVYGYLSSGELKASRIGVQYRISKEQLQEFIDSRAGAPQ